MVVVEEEGIRESPDKGEVVGNGRRGVCGTVRWGVEME